jgi:DNA helicase MCM9
MREMSSGETPWTFDQLQSYISLSKRINPDLDHDASAILTQYYKRQRKGDGYNAARTTVRLLQSSIRIAQGHARLMRHSAVSVLDAVNAVM